MNQIEYIYIDTDKSAQHAIDYLSKFNRLGYDTETTGLHIVKDKVKLLLMQLGTEEVAYLFDPRKIDTEVLREILESKSILKITHNCLMGDMRVILADGSKVPIWKLVKEKYSGKVWSINEKTGKLETKKIIGWIKKESRPCKDWIRIRVRGKGCLRLTKEHEVITDRGRIPAEDIIVGDRIKTIRPQLTNQQKSLIYGSCLGDASLILINSINSTSRAPYFSVAHATKQFNYVEFKIKVLGILCKNIKIESNNRGYSSHCPDAKLMRIRTSNDPRLNELYNNTNCGKEISDYWLENLDAPAFAIWYCDDGSLSGKGFNICTSRFGHFGTDKILKWMQNKNWPAYKTIRDDGHIYIHVNNPNNIHLKNDIQMQKVWNWFSLYIPQCMNYKIHKLFRNKYFDSWWFSLEKDKYSWSDEVTEVGQLFIDNKISRYSGYTKTYPSARKQYCLTVEGNNNFIAENLVVSNCKYDYQSTKHDTGIVLNNIFDTMLAYRLLTSGRIENGQGGYVPAGFRDKNKKIFPYKSLKFLCEKYLGLTLNKEIRKSFTDNQYTKEYTKQQLEYAAQDVLVLHPLCDILSEALIKEDLINTALLEFQFVRPCAEMELNGVYINKDKWRYIIDCARVEAEHISSKIMKLVMPLSDQNTLFGATTVNIKSQPQLLDIFYKLGYELESTDEKVLKKCDHPLADYVLEFRAYEKLISTYGEAILKKIYKTTNRLHFTLHQLGADTGRLSSEKPNIQNIPNDIEEPNSNVILSFRDCFEAEEDNVILTADYSQVELRILAEVSQDPKFLEIFRSGHDLHIITSQQVFRYTDSELDIYLAIKKKDKPNICLENLFSHKEIIIYKKIHDYRTKTKTINFGIVYGLSAWSLAERFKMPESEAEKILNNYFHTYSGIKKWLNNNGHEAVVNRYAKTLLGRKKYFTLANSDDEKMFRRSKAAIRRMGNNAVIQGTNADITKEALINLQEVYDDIPGAKILFTVHDEIVSECPETITERVAKIKAEVMKKAFHRFIKTVPVGKDDIVLVTAASHWSK